jgi:uncharacterized protein with von Willebrand factor type A (vWA) domain
MAENEAPRAKSYQVGDSAPESSQIRTLTNALSQISGGSQEHVCIANEQDAFVCSFNLNTTHALLHPVLGHGQAIRVWNSKY